MLHEFLSLLLVVGPMAVATSPKINAEKSARTEIKADQLKSWYDQKKSMVVLDARSAQYFNGTMLPNAKWMPSDASDKEIQTVIPSKKSLIVVYCAGAGCPASARLYDKLTSLGYTNVYEYHGGLQEWTEKGFATVKQ